MQPMLHRGSCTFYKLLFASLIFSFTCVTNHSAQAARQPTLQDLTVTYSGNNVPLGQVFKVIQKQTGYIAMYNVAATKLDTREKVSVKFNSTPLSEVMDYILRGKNLEWQLDDESILIFIKKETSGGSKKNPEGDSTIVLPSLTGRVIDLEGKPIVGAVVMIKGTQNGATTDPDGNFSLPNVKSNAWLLIRSLGYQTREIPVRGKSMLAQLNMVVSELDEQVVVAYGTTTKRFTTGNVASIKAKDIEKQPVSNPILALQGRVPGLFITQSNAVPGGVVTVRIQGQNSIGHGNDPFYVIDGVPFVGQTLTTTSGTGILGRTEDGAAGNPLSYINPADIESIEVLKDADATAIYGSRAANGAILITTKKGKAGAMKFDVNLQQGWGKASRRIKLLNTQQYLMMRHEALKNDGVATPPRSDYDINGVWDTTKSTDWQKTLMGATANYTNINGSISGGTAFAQYLIGGTYRRETSIFPGDFADQKGSMHFSVNSTSFNQKFNVQFSGNYLVDNNKLPTVDLGAFAASLAPNTPDLRKPDGTLNWAPNSAGASTITSNPLAYTLQKYKNRTSSLVANTLVSYQIVSGLEIKSSFGYNTLQTRELNTSPMAAVRPEFIPFTQRSSDFSNNSINSWIVEPQLTYKTVFGKSKIDFLLGTTIQQTNSNGESLRGRGYNNDAVLEDLHSASTVSIINTIASEYKYNALFGRLNYNWRDKYIINLSARRDGSSRFGSKTQFHNFGAVGAAWLFGEEDFIKDNISLISFGKLRGSYGTTGSDQIPDYQFLNLYTPNNSGIPYQGGTSLTPMGLTNPYLQWEETRKLQLGIDVGLLKDRILLGANYVNNRSSNQLLGYRLPSITGFQEIFRNFPATVQNTAWEFSLSTTNVHSDHINWSSNFNLTVPKNKLVRFPNLASSSYGDFLIEGQPLTANRYYRYGGVDPITGAYQFIDATGKTTASPDFETDRTLFLNTLPKLYGGLENSFSYKGFQLDVLFQFVKQRKTGLRFGNGGYPPGRKFQNQPASVLGRWQNPGDVSDIQKFTASSGPDFSLLEQYQLVTSSDASLEDASYIRMKNLSISYNIPQRWKEKLRLANCKIYMQGQNLLTFTKYTGIDPESGMSATLKLYTFGLQFTF